MFIFKVQSRRHEISKRQALAGLTDFPGFLAIVGYLKNIPMIGPFIETIMAQLFP